MHLRFEARGVSSELELAPGTWTLGGGTDDGIRFPGLPSRLLELDLAEERVRVRCSAPRLVGRAVLAAGVRRWLLPGERVHLARGVALWVEARDPTPATAVLLRSLLTPGAVPACTAAPALICVAGPDAGRVFPLLGPAAELGRVAGCAIRLRDGAVSRRHLALVPDRGRHRVMDLGGRNRAHCNGRWLRSGRLLTTGDLLLVGRTLLHYRAVAPVGDGPGRLPGGAAPPTAGPALSGSATGPPVPPAAASAAGAGRRSS